MLTNAVSCLHCWRNLMPMLPERPFGFMTDRVLDVWISVRPPRSGRRPNSRLYPRRLGSDSVESVQRIPARLYPSGVDPCGVLAGLSAPPRFGRRRSVRHPASPVSGPPRFGRRRFVRHPGSPAPERRRSARRPGWPASAPPRFGRRRSVRHPGSPAPERRRSGRHPGSPAPERRRSARRPGWPASAPPRFGRRRSVRRPGWPVPSSLGSSGVDACGILPRLYPRRLVPGGVDPKGVLAGLHPGRLGSGGVDPCGVLAGLLTDGLGSSGVDECGILPRLYPRRLGSGGVDPCRVLARLYPSRLFRPPSDLDLLRSNSALYRSHALVPDALRCLGRVLPCYVLCALRIISARLASSRAHRVLYPRRILLRTPREIVGSHTLEREGQHIH